MLKRFKSILCFGIILISLFNLNAFAYNDDTINISLECDNTAPISGEEFAISLNFLPSENLNISAYRLKVNFDSSKFSYKGLYSYINNDDFKSYENEGILTILYMTSEKGFNIKAKSSQPVLELNFKVLSNSDVGSTKISATIDGMCDYDTTAIPVPEIDPVTINITQPEACSCDLASLSAGEYQLVPAFSANITSYSVDVPYSKSSMEFEAIPVDEDATVKANRKTLKSTGTSTDINLTVTSSDKKSKKIYTVTVNRLSKESSNTVTTAALKTSSKNSGDNENDDDNEIALDDEIYINNSDENEISNDNFSSEDNTEKSIAQNNKIALQNSSAPLVVKENAFNLIVFLVCSVLFVAFSFFILKRKKN